jgi:hypothetical protein
MRFLNGMTIAFLFALPHLGRLAPASLYYRFMPDSYAHLGNRRVTAGCAAPATPCKCVRAARFEWELSANITAPGNRRVPLADPNKTAEDRKRIDVSQEHECRYWSKKLGVSEDELKAAVTAAGPMSDDVARHLGKAKNAGPVEAWRSRSMPRRPSGGPLRHDRRATAA